MKIQISDLKAALICAATKDVRHYLNGIYVKPEGGKLTTVSTDAPEYLGVQD